MSAPQAESMIERIGSLDCSQESASRHSSSHHWRRLAALLELIGAGSLASCGTLANGRGWGQDATIAPGWARVGDAARKNASDPWTWAPVAGAAVLQVDHWDRQVSDWARQQTPVFGSTKRAGTAGVEMRNALRDAWYVSMAATKSGDDPGGWALAKLEGVVVETVARNTATNLTSFLKDAVGRQRPDGDDNRSFPSEQATEAFAYARLSSENVDSTDLPEALRTPARVGLYALAIGSSWARVEAGDHFPSDVLFAAGATNFLVGFVHDAFLGLDGSSHMNFAVAPSGKGWMLGVTWSF